MEFELEREREGVGVGECVCVFDHEVIIHGFFFSSLISPFLIFQFFFDSVFALLGPYLCLLHSFGSVAPLPRCSLFISLASSFYSYLHLNSHYQSDAIRHFLYLYPSFPFGFSTLDGWISGFSQKHTYPPVFFLLATCPYKYMDLDT